MNHARLAPIAALSLLLPFFLATAGCAGDDTNPPAPPPSDAGADATSSDGAAKSDGAGSADTCVKIDAAGESDAGNDADAT